MSKRPSRSNSAVKPLNFSHFFDNFSLENPLSLDNSKEKENALSLDISLSLEKTRNTPTTTLKTTPRSTPKSTPKTTPRAFPKATPKSKGKEVPSTPPLRISLDTLQNFSFTTFGLPKSACAGSVLSLEEEELLPKASLKVFLCELE
jgi:hypothetical protein